LLVSLSQAPSASAAAADHETFVYRRALPGYRYEFPQDHFAHPEFRTEWWYYTGNLRDVQGKRFGFELVFFRQAQRRGATQNQSAWRVDDLYLAHLALTDVDGKRFYDRQRLNRAGPGIAGADFARRRIWNGNWSSQWDGEKQTLEAVAEEFRFRLRLNPLKPPVIHGTHGVSQKAPGEGQASYYVSFPRLEVTGEVWLDRSRHEVRGTAWMDHEWFTHELAQNQVGWDWFSVQMDNGAELMLFELRRKDGSIDPFSSGTYIDREGRAHHLTRAEFSLTPGAQWKSPTTGTAYPVHWQIRVPSFGVMLEASAQLNEQELISRDNVAPTYWEGAVTYSGSSTGVGYLEMTGYDKPMRLE
jgi:predicted secreted hydrolase